MKRAPLERKAPTPRTETARAARFARARASGGLAYKRILLKLSGEALLGEDKQFGVDRAFTDYARASQDAWSRVLAFIHRDPGDGLQPRPGSLP